MKVINEQLAKSRKNYKIEKEEYMNVRSQNNDIYEKINDQYINETNI